MHVDRLVAIMARPRDPVHGCEWHVAQTWATLLDRLGLEYEHRKDGDAAYIAQEFAKDPNKKIEKSHLPSSRTVRRMKEELQKITAVQQISLYLPSLGDLLHESVQPRSHCVAHVEFCKPWAQAGTPLTPFCSL